MQTAYLLRFKLNYSRVRGLWDERERLSAVFTSLFLLRLENASFPDEHTNEEQETFVISIEIDFRVIWADCIPLISLLLSL